MTAPAGQRRARARPGGKLRVCFAPDYSHANPYQRLLADALDAHGCEVALMDFYRRGLPLTRGTRALASDILHLHWPDAYFPTSAPLHGLLRKLRFPLDLWLACRRAPLVVTAHNLLPHSRAGEPLVRLLSRHAYRRADAVIAHGANSERAVRDQFQLPCARLHRVPHGDLAVELPPPRPRRTARRALGLPEGAPLCLMFGAIADYKGIGEAVAYWRRAHPPATLAIIGNPHSAAYGERVAAACSGSDSGILYRPGWLDDDALASWLSAADCALFNYRRIFVSGAACLARSWGLPALIPRRLDSLDLDEPDPRVIRFESLASGFAAALEEACALGRDYAAAADWRAATAWPLVAERTAAVYRASWR